MFILRTDLKLVKNKAIFSMGELNENNTLSYKVICELRTVVNCLRTFLVKGPLNGLNYNQ